MQLNSTKIYSKLICTACDEQLKNFSILQKDLITKQLKLQKFVDELDEKQKSNMNYIKDKDDDNTVSSYLNPLVVIKLETDLISNENCYFEDESKVINCNITHSPKLNINRQIPEIVRKRRGQRKSNDSNK